MKRFLSLTMCFVIVMAAGTALASATKKSSNYEDLLREMALSPPRSAPPGDSWYGIPHGAEKLRDSFLGRESAGPDTFDVYGGPLNPLRDPDGVPGSGDEYIEGRFENESGSPAGVHGVTNVPSGVTGNWQPYDITDQPVHWKVSTFNASNLNGNGAGNLAAWSGEPDSIGGAVNPDTEFWTSAPGYGDEWFDVLEFESDPVTDPASGLTVDLDFFFNVDVEPGYDFFLIQYEVGGAWTTVASLSGTNRDSLGSYGNGVQYSLVGAAPIVYQGGDYSAANTVKIRMVIQSDGFTSDQTGGGSAYPNGGDGGAQVDDITVTIPGQTPYVEDFEGGGPYLWNGNGGLFHGDFSKIFAVNTDSDICRSNITPQLTFIDDGTPPRNDALNRSTGGSTSPTWSYGIAGGWVTNYTGGINNNRDEITMNNQVWSPEIDWVLDEVQFPGSNDPDMLGGIVRFTVWSHLELNDGTFYNQDIRTFDADPDGDPLTDDGEWSGWGSSGTFFGDQFYSNRAVDFSNFVTPTVTKVQTRFRFRDLAAVFGFPGGNATPGPWFDNVRIYKYRYTGISLFYGDDINRFQDAFPTSGNISAETQADRDALDIRLDTANDTNIQPAQFYVMGDSMTVSASPILPGTSLAELKLVWTLKKNTFFEDAIRDQPAGPFDQNFAATTDVNGFELWSGEVLADSNVINTSTGEKSETGFYADLPDSNFFYPGDVLQYYWQATDNEGRVTTDPADISGFGVFDEFGQSEYSRVAMVRGLPTITAWDPNADVDPVTQDPIGANVTPEILFYNDFGFRTNENLGWKNAFDQLGLYEGRDYDTYTTIRPDGNSNNELGSAGIDGPLGRRGPGATSDQLEGYRTIIGEWGNLDDSVISNGSNASGNNKSPTLQTLTSWKNLPGQRNIVYFGDGVASGLVTNQNATYVAQEMSLNVVSPDGLIARNGQVAPVVRTTGAFPEFNTEFIAYGGCLAVNEFDELTPAGLAVATHGFVNDATNSLFGGLSAGITHDRLVGNDRKVDLTFPFGLLYVRDNVARVLPGANGMANFLSDILEYLDETSSIDGDATAAPSLRPAELSIQPNPFNPKTEIRFALPKAGMAATVKVFNVRGELVTTLHDGVASSADLNLEWNGTDRNNSRVASGVYLVKAVTEGFSDTKKAVLVK